MPLLNHIFLTPDWGSFMGFFFFLIYVKNLTFIPFRHLCFVTLGVSYQPVADFRSLLWPAFVVMVSPHPVLHLELLT